ncbi:MAG: hypothetical protein WC119_00790 [Synergistaceae bacterium]
MAKPDEKKTLATPSAYGSHASMIEQDLMDQPILVEQPNLVLLKDERGLYLTDRFRLDNKQADPNRHASDEYREAQIKGNGIDIKWTAPAPTECDVCVPAEGTIEPAQGTEA